MHQKRHPIADFVSTLFVIIGSTSRESLRVDKMSTAKRRIELPFRDKQIAQIELCHQQMSKPIYFCACVVVAKPYPPSFRLGLTRFGWGFLSVRTAVRISEVDIFVDITDGCKIIVLDCLPRRPAATKRSTALTRALALLEKLVKWKLSLSERSALVSLARCLV